MSREITATKAQREAKRLLAYTIHDTIQNWYTRERDTYGMEELTQVEQDQINAAILEIGNKILAKLGGKNGK